MYYLDTSAAIKLFIDEAETKALRNFISTKKATFIAAEIIDVELIRNLMKQAPEFVGKGLAVLDYIAKIEVNTELIREAMSILPDFPLRSLDALHVAACHRLRRSIDGLVTYDLEMASASRALGIDVLSPGATI